MQSLLYDLSRGAYGESDGDPWRSGSVIYLPHRLPENRQQVVVIAAGVEATSTEGGRPILNLRSVDGHSIIKGDSGGGIWGNGQVGNMWKTLWVETQLLEHSVWGSREITEVTTDTSIAASLPLNGFTLEALLTPGNAPEIMADQPSGKLFRLLDCGMYYFTAVE